MILLVIESYLVLDSQFDWSSSKISVSFARIWQTRWPFPGEMVPQYASSGHVPVLLLNTLNFNAGIYSKLVMQPTFLIVNEPLHDLCN